MKKLIIVSALAFGFLQISACAPATRFEWGNYENSLYAYSKNPLDNSKYAASLEDAIARGKATNRLAPGLCAELGYLKLSEGDTAAAISLFNEEISNFPESSAFLKRTLDSLKTTPNTIS